MTNPEYVPYRQYQVVVNKAITLQEKVDELEAQLAETRNYMVSCPWCGESLKGKPLGLQFSHIINHGDDYKAKLAELRDENERIKRYSRCSMAPHANARPCIACGYPKD